MPTSSVAKTSGDGDAKAAQQTLHPIRVLDTPAAQVVGWLRPAVLAGGCAARLPALVADPTTTLWTALPVVAAVQVAYAVVCLPVVGAAKKGQQVKKSSRSSAAILSLLLTAMVTPVIYIVLVLFGAPLLSRAGSTALCAAHMATLAAFPVFYTRGIDGPGCAAVAGAYAPLDEVFGGVVGVAAGAWLGAVPIPLDWDRPWQTWPVTIVVGAYAGCAVASKLLGSRVLYGKTLVWGQGEEEEEEETKEE